jgi:FMN reductase (NADPH)
LYAVRPPLTGARPWIKLTEITKSEERSRRMNETLRLIDDRVSLRRFADRSIDSKEIDAIIHSAMRAPTAGNMMLYTILQVNAPEKKQRLAETCGHPFIADAPLVLVFLADMQRWVDFFESNDVPAHCAEEDVEYRTPDTSKLLMCCCDALIAAQNSVLAAESMGIGSCYIGDVMGHAEEHRSLFDLPPFAFPIALVCFGHRPGGIEQKQTSRFDRKYVHHCDSYRRFSARDLREMLSEIDDKFSSVLKQRQVNLAQLTYEGFMMGKAAQEERRSVDVLLRPWVD